MSKPLGGRSAMCTIVLVVAALLVVASSVVAARFTDTFDTFPADVPRLPFTWAGAIYNHRAAETWSVTDGVLNYHVENAEGVALRTSLASMGIRISDDTAWTLETAFRHLSSTAPRPAYEAIAYLRWRAAQPEQMHVVAVMYDAQQQALTLYNSGHEEQVTAVDLSGDFHRIRIAVAEGLLRLWVDEALRAGPLPVRSMAGVAGSDLYLGSVTRGETVSLHCQWDYLAFTDQGALAPGEGDWDPASHTEPVAEGLTMMEGVPDNPGYAGITVLAREKGTETWDRAMPELWRRVASVIASEPRRIEVPFYRYPDEEGPSVQNVYPDWQALACDDRRGVAVAMLTRGVGDTATGYVDYKMWYRVTTDGGETWSELRPLVAEGDEFSPMHPNPYVWIGRNGFCYASIPPLLRMSNGEILMPFYFAPVDEEGNYYNPLNAYTFGYVAVAIGRWNEAGDDLIWTVSDAITISERQSARGFSECAVIELSEPGHILMVMRGSNRPDPWGDMPPVKWRTLSTDYGRTWSEPEPFTYSDGAPFMSPSSCSAFIRSAVTGKVYWVGNISRIIPDGNSPRYPLVIAELDEETLGLRRETVTIVDDRGPNDPPELQLSNFKLIEDPATGHILILFDRYVSAEHRDNPDAGAHTYIISVQ